MKSVIEVFKDCTEVVSDAFPEADASERLRAAIGLVDLTLRRECERANHERWEQARESANAPVPAT